VGRGELRQERGQRGLRAAAVGLEERLHVRRDRGGRVWGGGLMRGHVERVEAHCRGRAASGLGPQPWRCGEVAVEPLRYEEQGLV
jgi:hypothetical protein